MVYKAPNRTATRPTSRRPRDLLHERAATVKAAAEEIDTKRFPWEAIRSLVSIRHAAAMALDSALIAGRTSGLTWGQLAGHFGVSEQAVQQRHAKLSAQLRLG